MSHYAPDQFEQWMDDVCVPPRNQAGVDAVRSHDYNAFTGECECGWHPADANTKADLAYAHHLVGAIFAAVDE